MKQIKAVIPVAGFGTRLRPHTYTTPKALLQVAGKPILGHILDQVKEQGIMDVVLIIGYLGSKIKEYVEAAYPEMNFTYAQQDKALGPAHAVWLARPFIRDTDKLLIIFGDTIFVGDISKGLMTTKDASIAVKAVSDPRRFGVVIMKARQVIDVAEKPDYIKPMDAMIGIYVINNTKMFYECLQEMVDQEKMTKGEFFLPDAFKIMIEKGAHLTTWHMEGWFDCGKPETLLETNRFLLTRKNPDGLKGTNTVFIEPVYMGKNVTVENSVIGPYVSIADNVSIKGSIISDSIINLNAEIENAKFESSLIGENASVKGGLKKLNVGDNSGIIS